MLRWTASLALIALAWGAPLPADATSGNPPDRLTGAPGEATCGLVRCHGEPNIGPGSILLTGPTGYAAGDTVLFDLMVTHTGQTRWGFQLTIVDYAGNRFGELVRLDSLRTQLSVDETRDYLKHTDVGTDAGIADTSAGWQFAWVPPATPQGPAFLYIAANAANNDSTNAGDFVYTTVGRLDAERCCIGRRGNVDCDPDNDVALTDVLALLDHLFISTAPVCCMATADVDADGHIGLTDASTLLSHLYFMRLIRELPACPEEN